MSWINTAILATAALASVNILESHILSRRMPTTRSYLVIAAFFHLSFGLIFFLLFPLPAGVTAEMVLIAIAAGLLRGAGLALMLYTMRREEVSLVIPVVFTYPVFVALLAVPLLGEQLSFLQWLAIIMVVLGAIIVSARRSPTGATTWPARVFLLLIGSSLLLALADVTSKYAMTYFSSWKLYAITGFCIASVFWINSARRGTFREVGNIEQKSMTAVVVVATQILAATGISLSLWAIGEGRVSLVSTVLGSRPVFVAIYSIILSRLFPKFIMWSAGSATMVALRLAATLMIVGGISIIYLT